MPNLRIEQSIKKLQDLIIHQSFKNDAAVSYINETLKQFNNRLINTNFSTSELEYFHAELSSQLIACDKRYEQEKNQEAKLVAKYIGNLIYQIILSIEHTVPNSKICTIASSRTVLLDEIKKLDHSWLDEELDISTLMLTSITSIKTLKKYSQSLQYFSFILQESTETSNLHRLLLTINFLNNHTVYCALKLSALSQTTHNNPKLLKILLINTLKKLPQTPQNVHLKLPEMLTDQERRNITVTERLLSDLEFFIETSKSSNVRDDSLDETYNLRCQYITSLDTKFLDANYFIAPSLLFRNSCIDKQRLEIFKLLLNELTTFQLLFDLYISPTTNSEFHDTNEINHLFQKLPEISNKAKLLIGYFFNSKNPNLDFSNQEIKAVFLLTPNNANQEEALQLFAYFQKIFKLKKTSTFREIAFNDFKMLSENSKYSPLALLPFLNERYSFFISESQPNLHQLPNISEENITKILESVALIDTIKAENKKNTHFLSLCRKSLLSQNTQRLTTEYPAESSIISENFFPTFFGANKCKILYDKTITLVDLISSKSDNQSHNNPHHSPRTK